MDIPYGIFLMQILMQNSHFADTSRSDITILVISLTKLKNQVGLFFKGIKLLSWCVLNSSFCAFLVRRALSCRGLSLQWNLLKKSENWDFFLLLFFFLV